MLKHYKKNFIFLFVKHLKRQLTALLSVRPRKTIVFVWESSTLTASFPGHYSFRTANVLSFHFDPFHFVMEIDRNWIVFLITPSRTVYGQQPRFYSCIPYPSSHPMVSEGRAFQTVSPLWWSWRSGQAGSYPGWCIPGRLGYRWRCKVPSHQRACKLRVL